MFEGFSLSKGHTVNSLVTAVGPRVRIADHVSRCDGGCPTARRVKESRARCSGVISLCIASCFPLIRLGPRNGPASTRARSWTLTNDLPTVAHLPVCPASPAGGLAHEVTVHWGECALHRLSDRVAGEQKHSAEGSRVAASPARTFVPRRPPHVDPNNCPKVGGWDLKEARRTLHTVTSGLVWQEWARGLIFLSETAGSARQGWTSPRPQICELRYTENGTPAHGSIGRAPLTRVPDPRLTRAPADLGSSRWRVQPGRAGAPYGVSALLMTGSKG